jgi:hypothetical protein
MNNRYSEDGQGSYSGSPSSPPPSQQQLQQLQQQRAMSSGIMPTSPSQYQRPLMPMPMPTGQLGYGPISPQHGRPAVYNPMALPPNIAMGRGMAYPVQGKVSGMPYVVPQQPLLMKQANGSPATNTILMGGGVAMSNPQLLQQMTPKKRGRGRKSSGSVGGSGDADMVGDDDLSPDTSAGKKSGKNIKKKNRQRAVRHNWTAEQDEMLISAINSKKYSDNGEKIRWTKISQEVFESKLTPQSVYQRYMRVINPKLNHKEWSNQEDKKLTKLYQELGDQWALIAKKMNGLRADVWIRQRAVRLNLIQDGGTPKKQRQAPEKKAAAQTPKRKRRPQYSSDEESEVSESSSEEEELSEEELSGDEAEGDDEVDPSRLAESHLIFYHKIHQRGQPETDLTAQLEVPESQTHDDGAKQAAEHLQAMQAMTQDTQDTQGEGFDEQGEEKSKAKKPPKKKPRLSKKEKAAQRRRAAQTVITNSPIFIKKRTPPKNRKYKTLHDLFLDHQVVTKHPEKYATVTIQVSELLKNFTATHTLPTPLEADCTIGLFYGISAPMHSQQNPICLHSYRSHIISTSEQPLVVRFPTNLLSFYENFKPNQTVDAKTNTLLMNQLFLGVQIRQAVKASQNQQQTQYQVPPQDDKVIPIDQWNNYMYNNNLSTFHLFSGGFFDGRYQFQFYNATTNQIQPIAFEINFTDYIPQTIPNCPPNVEFTFPKVHFEALRVTQAQYNQATQMMAPPSSLPPLHNYVVCKVLHMKRDEERCIESMSLRWDHNCPLCSEFTQRTVATSDNAFKFLQHHMNSAHAHMFRFYFFTHSQTYYSIIATELKVPLPAPLQHEPQQSQNNNIIPRELRNISFVHPTTLEPIHPLAVGQVDEEGRYWSKWEQDRNKRSLEAMRDIPNSEREFMIHWNKYIMERKGALLNDEEVVYVCQSFIATQYNALLQRGEMDAEVKLMMDGQMKQMIMCHLYRLHELSLLTKQQLVESLKQLQQATLPQPVQNMQPSELMLEQPVLADTHPHMHAHITDDSHMHTHMADDQGDEGLHHYQNQ